MSTIKQPISITDYAVSETIDNGFTTIVVLEPRIIRNYFQEIDLGRYIANVVNQYTSIVIFEYSSKSDITNHRNFKQLSTSEVKSLDLLLKEREISNHGQLFIKFITHNDLKEKLSQSEQIINYIYTKIANLPTKNLYEETVKFCLSII